MHNTKTTERYKVKHFDQLIVMDSFELFNSFLKLHVLEAGELGK